MSEFDLKAAGWDQNKMHWERSEAIADEIKRQVPLNREMSALEYGAGTGMASFLLKDELKNIILMDNSTEMVKVMKEKIRKSKVSNMKALNFDLEKNDYRKEKFDLIFTQMVLHHVDDVGKIINRFSKLLKPRGYLVIADLYSEDGSFHGEGFEGHKGFDIEELSELVRHNGFIAVSHKQCFVIDRMISDTESREFPVFLLKAIRN
jgi:2-polyprenyl-3-methyl-5-hydroxy-6-metoxy-1,4-benzoquinol methylase